MSTPRRIAAVPCGAVEAYETVLALLRHDWGLTEGETVEGRLENIKQLKK